MTLQLNGFHVSLASDTFSVFAEDFPDPDGLKARRELLGSDWFTHWRDGHLYGIPRVDNPSVKFGEIRKLSCTDHDHLHVLNARLNDCLPGCFPRYDVVRRRPFTFLAQKDEFIAKVTNNWPNKPALLRHFEIRSKFELESKIIELRDGQTQLAVFVDVATRWTISAALDELQNAGVSLQGLHAVRRKTAPGQKRLVGRIEKVLEGNVLLEEAFDDDKSIPVSDVFLEGNFVSFSRCLSVLLGGRFRDLEAGWDAEEARLLTGPGLQETHKRMQSVLSGASPIRLTSDLECSLSSQVTIRNSADYSTSIFLHPAQYCFDRARTKLNNFAWPGLEQFGPFDRESFPKRTPRILVVCPDSLSGRVGQSIRLFRDGITSDPKSRFSMGFARTFHLVNPEFVSLQVPLLALSGGSPAEAYRKALTDHLARSSDYDAAITVILDEHSQLPDPVSPYLHAKSLLLTHGIPVQEIRSPTITASVGSLQYIFQNVATALYAKMGGIPWTMDHGLSVDDEIVIGMGTAELSGSRFERRQRHIGITTVFRGDGNYLLSNVSHECTYEDYPAVLRASTTDTLKEIKQRNAWRKGDTVRLVFHAFKPLRDIEVADIVRASVDEVGSEQTIEFAFLTVSFEHPFKVMDTSQRGTTSRYKPGPAKAIYVPERGHMIQLGRYTRLLCTNGPRLIKTAATPLPSPVLIHLHKNSTYRDLPYLTDQLLKFTALSWRSTLPAEKPVTIFYSALIAELLARLQVIPGWSPAILNTRLRTSKWFL